MRFLLNCGCVSTTVGMHHMGKKTRWELQKNAVSYFEQILKATPLETTDVPLLTSHLTNHPSKMNKICATLLEKQGQTHK